MCVCVACVRAVCYSLLFGCVVFVVLVELFSCCVVACRLFLNKVFVVCGLCCCVVCCLCCVVVVGVLCLVLVDCSSVGLWCFLVLFDFHVLQVCLFL